MAISYTYDSLRTALIATTEDGGSEFESGLDNIIGLAETKVLRELDLELFDSLASGTFSTLTPLVTKPSGFLALRSFWYEDGDGDYTPIEPKSYEFVRDYWPRQSLTTATPKYLADYSDVAWIIAGSPSTAFTWRAKYIARPAGLSSGNTTSWLSNNVGDLLFYACLVGCEAFLKADERVNLWKSEYRERLLAARTELRRETRDDYAPMEAAPNAASQ
jgi:hypothetical protein